MLIDGEEETRSVLRLGDNPVPAVDQKARDARPQQPESSAITILKGVSPANSFTRSHRSIPTAAPRAPAWGHPRDSR